MKQLGLGGIIQVPNLCEADVISRDVPLLFGFGGGVNTLALLVLLVQKGIKPDLITFADTGGRASDGGEKPETYAHINNVVEPWLASHGLTLVRVYNDSPKAGYSSLEDDCLKKNQLPSRAFGMSSCAMRWKIEPQDKYINHWPPTVAAWKSGKKPIKILGYDGGEGGRAEIYEDKKLRYWYPLIEWGFDRYDCESIILDAGLPLPPKSACFYCPSSTKQEVIQLANTHPELFARALKMERQAQEAGNLDVIRGLGRRWSWAELIAANDEQRARMADAPVEACMICDDGGCPTEDTAR